MMAKETIGRRPTSRWHRARKFSRPWTMSDIESALFPCAARGPDCRLWSAQLWSTQPLSGSAALGSAVVGRVQHRLALRLELGQHGRRVLVAGADGRVGVQRGGEGGLDLHLVLHVRDGLG